MFTYNTLVVLAGAGLLGLLCGVVGSFAVLRRRALLGDVIAHATLPGIAAAYLIVGSKSLPALLAGAFAAGLLGLGVLAFVRRKTRTKDDAAMGIVLAVLFGAGISLSRYVQNTATDDSHAGLDSFFFGKTAGMVLSDVYLTIGVCAFSLITIAVLFKEFELVCFDGGFAQSLGWKVAWIDYLILCLLALAVVIGLPMVGVVLVAALTIIPPVAARLWTMSLHVMLVLSAIFGVVAAVAGVLISASGDNLPSGPVIILCAAVIFILSALLAPGRGLTANFFRLRKLRLEQGLLALRRLAQEPQTPQALRLLLAELGIRNAESVLAYATRKGVLIKNGPTLQISPEAE